MGIREASPTQPHREDGRNTRWCSLLPPVDRQWHCHHHSSTMQPSARCLNAVGSTIAFNCRLWNLSSVTRTPGFDFWKGPEWRCYYVYILRRVSVSIVGVDKQYYILRVYLLSQYPSAQSTCAIILFLSAACLGFLHYLKKTMIFKKKKNIDKIYFSDFPYKFYLKRISF
jgi:hypothetical protein